MKHRFGFDHDNGAMRCDTIFLTGAFVPSDLKRRCSPHSTTFREVQRERRISSLSTRSASSRQRLRADGLPPWKKLLQIPCDPAPEFFQ